MNTNVTYFEKAGRHNTIKTLEISKKRALELDIDQIVIATTHGYTALEASKLFSDTQVELIGVGLSFACTQEGWDMKPAEKRALEDANVRVFLGQHSLSRGVAEAFDTGSSTAEIVAQTLYLFGQGMKVAVEVAIMAAEAGLVPIDKKLIAIGGTSEGADTAIVMTPCYAYKLKEIKIHEILCKPVEF